MATEAATAAATTTSRWRSSAARGTSLGSSSTSSTSCAAAARLLPQPCQRVASGVASRARRGGPCEVAPDSVASLPHTRVRASAIAGDGRD
eukprot:1594285-Prymnesium_polylepis.1